MEYVYHGSKKSGIEKLEPRKSSHGIEYVYATPSKEIAMVMSCHMHDLNSVIAGRGTKESPLVVVERRPGVFDKFLHDYANVYTLNGENFYSGTNWGGEVVSEKAQIPLKEEYIEDVYSELLKSEQEGIIKMYHYPDRPEYIPLDNSDLITNWLDREGVSIEKKMMQLSVIAKEYPELRTKTIMAIMKCAIQSPSATYKFLSKGLNIAYNNLTSQIKGTFSRYGEKMKNKLLNGKKFQGLPEPQKLEETHKQAIEKHEEKEQRGNNPWQLSPEEEVAFRKGEQEVCEQQKLDQLFNRETAKREGPDSREDI